MKKFIIIMAIGAFALAGLMLPLVRFSAAPLDSVQALLAAYHSAGPRQGVHGQFSGVALVARDGEVTFHEVFGHADVDGDIPLTRDDRFLIGPVSQQFTAVLVLQQVERGTLRLDQNTSTSPSTAWTLRRAI